MFTDKQNQLLKYNLEGSRVKTRQLGSISLSYLEGYDLIDTANFAFGFGNWSYRVTTLEQVSEEVNERQNKVIGYRAVVAVTVHDVHHKNHITREDVGYGIGIARDYASAHESGGKEATTDALKRALRTFGNQFGNALYDKTQKNVDHHTQQQQKQIPQVQQQPQQQTSDPYAPLRQLGLDVQEQNGELIIIGQTYGKQNTIKGLNVGFRWDASRKIWYLPKNQQAA